MFSCVILSDDFKLDLSGWDVSKVTNHTGFFSELDESTWEIIASTKITEPEWS